MKNLLFLLFSMLVFGQKIENIKLNSKILNQEREIWVYTPFGFDENKSKNYDVIYVFDAQARAYFDLVHSAINFYNEGMFPMVVVELHLLLMKKPNKVEIPIYCQNQKTIKQQKNITVI